MWFLLVIASVLLLIIKLIYEVADNAQLRRKTNKLEEDVGRLKYELEARTRLLSGLGTGAEGLLSRVDSSLTEVETEKRRLEGELELANEALLEAQRAQQQAVVDVRRAQRAEAQHRRDVQEAKHAAAIASHERANALAARTAAAEAAADAERARQGAIQERDEARRDRVAATTARSEALQQVDLFRAQAEVAKRRAEEIDSLRNIAEEEARHAKQEARAAQQAAAEALEREESMKMHATEQANAHEADLKQTILKLQESYEAKLADAASDVEWQLRQAEEESMARLAQREEEMSSKVQSVEERATQAEKQAAARTEEAVAQATEEATSRTALRVISCVQPVIQHLLKEQQELETRTHALRQAKATLQETAETSKSQQQLLKAELANLKTLHDDWVAEKIALEERGQIETAASVKCLEDKLAALQERFDAAMAEVKNAKQENSRLEAELEQARRRSPSPERTQEVDNLRRLNARLLGEIASCKRRLKELEANNGNDA